MEESANRPLRRQSVIERDRRSRFLDMEFDFCLAQQLQRLWTSAQPAELATTQDDHTTTVVQQLVDIGRLDPGYVMRAGLVPVPAAAAAGPELVVAARSEAVDLNPSPAKLENSRRTGQLINGALHCYPPPFSTEPVCHL